MINDLYINYIFCVADLFDSDCSLESVFVTKSLCPCSGISFILSLGRQAARSLISFHHDPLNFSSCVCFCSHRVIRMQNRETRKYQSFGEQPNTEQSRTQCQRGLLSSRMQCTLKTIQEYYFQVEFTEIIGFWK